MYATSSAADITRTLPAISKEYIQEREQQSISKQLKRIMYGHAADSQAAPPSIPVTETRPVRKSDWISCKIAAESHIKKGEYKEAEAVLLDALALAKDFNPKDPRLAYTVDSLAGLSFAMGKLDKAEEYCKQATSITENIFGANHVKVAVCLNNLAGIYYQQRRYELAEPLAVRILTVYNKACGAEHSDVGLAAHNLGMIYHAQGKLELARLMYERAVPIRKRDLDHASPELRALEANYANLQAAIKQGSKVKAVRSDLRQESGVWHVFDAPIALAS